jgi:hypothetical protein
LRVLHSLLLHLIKVGFQGGTVRVRVGASPLFNLSKTSCLGLELELELGLGLGTPNRLPLTMTPTLTLTATLNPTLTQMYYLVLKTVLLRVRVKVTNDLLSPIVMSDILIQTLTLTQP